MGGNGDQDTEGTVVVRYRAGCLLPIIVPLVAFAMVAAGVGTVWALAAWDPARRGIGWSFVFVGCTLSSLFLVSVVGVMAVYHMRLLRQGRLELSDHGLCYHTGSGPKGATVAWHEILSVHGHDSWRIRYRRQQEKRPQELIIWHAPGLACDRRALRQTIADRAGLTRRSLSLLWGFGYARPKPW